MNVKMSNSSKFQAKLLKIISVNNNLNERSFQSGINVLCCYDPEGVIVKFARGELVQQISGQTFLCVCTAWRITREKFSHLAMIAFVNF